MTRLVKDGRIFNRVKLLFQKYGYVGNIEEITEQNSNFRKVVFTGNHLQLVAMSLKPGEEIEKKFTQK